MNIVYYCAPKGFIGTGPGMQEFIIARLREKHPDAGGITILTHDGAPLFGKLFDR